MLLTITTTHKSATDLGFLLHKNPANVRSVDLAFGRAHVFYPEASDDRCSATLLLDIDPIGLVRGRGRGEGTLRDYVNDRPYVASSFMSVAIAKLYGTALGGRSGERPKLADTPIPLEAHLPVLPSRGGEALVRSLFEPLGYAVEADHLPLDERFPEWGPSRYFDVRLEGTARLQDVLSHLYVLLPVLDDEKHYWVGEDEIDKLLRRGETWLSGHPERELITDRYLKHQRRLTRAALARLVEDEVDPDAEEESHDREEEAVEEKIGLRDQRIGSVISALKASGASRVLDLGCGSGRLLQALVKERQFQEIVGVDVSAGALSAARRYLRMDRLPTRDRDRLQLLQGSLTYRDRRLTGFDAAVLMEVVEHLDPSRLDAFERAVFREAHPGAVVVTTPNREFNVRFEGLPAGELRHRDHRFEWTREEFRGWAEAVADRSGYTVRFLPVGPEDAEAGSPTQMGVFTS